MGFLSKPFRFFKLMMFSLVRFVPSFISERVRNIDLSWRNVGFFGVILSLIACKFRQILGPRSEPGEGEENNSSLKSEAKDEEDPQSEGPRPETATDQSDDSEENTQCRVDCTDELYCEYDSTWDTEEDSQGQSQDRCGDRDQQEDTGNSSSRSSRKSRNQSYKFRRFQAAAKDLQNYRHDYPHKPLHWRSPDINEYPNLKFYLGERPSLPDNVYIHEFHNEWYGHYEYLESVHSYIQWLFPLQEPGMNFEASTLTKEEIQKFCQNDKAKNNLLKSYKLMLDFYGIELCDEKTGEVRRAPNWRERFNNLNIRTHNNLRITRILKCLATLGFQCYQKPLVHFFLEETVINGELPNVKESVLNYFLFAVRDKQQRRTLLRFAFEHYDKNEEFVWCPKQIQMKLLEIGRRSMMSDVLMMKESAEAELNDH